MYNGCVYWVITLTMKHSCARSFPRIKAEGQTISELIQRKLFYSCFIYKQLVRSVNLRLHKFQNIIRMLLDLNFLYRLLVCVKDKDVVFKNALFKCRIS